MDAFDAWLLGRERAKAGRIWFWKPQWYWHGWKTLLPAFIGHDDYARRTLCLGWTVTGRVIIALSDCGSKSCHEYAVRAILSERATAADV